MRPAAPPALRLPRAERSFRRPVAISAVLHGGLAALLLWYAARTAERTTPAPGRPGGGAGQVTYVTLLPYRAAPAAAPPISAPAARPVVSVQVRDVTAAPSVTELAHVSLVSVSDLGLVGGGGRGGPGSGGGVGAAGGTGGDGGAGGIFPPQARYSILPPLPRPASVRGRSFRVHFWIDAGGRVTRVTVTPALPDAGYAKRFIALMYQYTFTPALRPDGTPVPGEAVLTITL